MLPHNRNVLSSLLCEQFKFVVGKDTVPAFDCQHHILKDAIEDIFGIYIDCDRQNGYQYYIGNDYVLREDSVQNWMLSTLSVNNIISESLSLQDRILLQPVPSEGNYLRMAIEAMKKGVRIEVDYMKYGTDTPNHLNFEPYCINQTALVYLGAFPPRCNRRKAGVRLLRSLFFRQDSENVYDGY